jgi:molybdate transport system ATP-binding protein
VSPGNAIDYLPFVAPVLRRITRRSADQLGLAPGKPVYAQIKSVALLA